VEVCGFSKHIMVGIECGDLPSFERPDMIRLLRVFVPASTLALLAFEASVVIAAFIASTYLFLDLDPTDYLLNNLGLVSVALVSISLLAGIYLQDLYSQVRVKSRLLLAQQLLMAAGITFLLQALISATAPEDLSLPFPVILSGCLLSIVVLFAGRLLFSVYVLPRVGDERLLLIGESPLLDDIESYLKERPQLGIQVAGRIHTPEFGEGAPHQNLEELIRSFHSNRVVVAQPDAYLAGELLEMRFLGYSIQEAAGTYAKISNREACSGLGPARLLYSKEFEPSTRDLFFQSVSNTLLAAVACIVLSPLMLLIALLVRLSLRGPAVERRIRMGQGGTTFTLFSFRVGDASEVAPVSFVGRVLTRTGLYAIPQFFNVLRGEMSIVGPRPQKPDFVRELTSYIPFYPHRLKMRPGMTGLAQIEMRAFAGPRDSLVELEYDIILQGIKNILLWSGQPWR
jgi:lipopolysaccharide/colanic/teichoic acid biosynthesis glycosyltransferase